MSDTKKTFPILQLTVLLLSCVVLMLILVIVNILSREVIQCNCNGEKLNKSHSILDNSQIIKNLTTATPSTKLPQTFGPPFVPSTHLQEKTTQSQSSQSTEDSYDAETTTQWDDLRCDEGHKCVMFYLCKENGEIERDGSHLLHPRSNRGSTSTTSCPDLEVCCKRHDYKSSTIAPN